jgi:hypothetical protein
MFAGVVACKNQTNKTGLPSDITVININNPVDISIEQLIGDYDTIRLEVTDESLLNSISQLHIMNNKLYILNGSNDAVFIYSNTGKFIKKIYSVGKGPAEYVSIGNFSLDYINQQIVVTDLFSDKIIIYDSLGNYRNTVRLKFLPVRIASTKSGFVHFCSEPVQEFPNREMNTTNIHFFDETGNFLYATKQDDTPLPIEIRSDQSLINLQNGTFLYQPIISDTVYFVSENSVKIKYVFRSDSKFKIPTWQDRQNISFTFKDRNSVSHIRNMIQDNYLFSWGEILDSDNYFYVGFSGLLDNDKVKVFYNKSKDKAITVCVNTLGGDKMLVDIFMNAPLAADNKSFYTVIPDRLMVEETADKIPKGKLKTFLENTNFDDTNPLLIKFSINNKIKL